MASEFGSVGTESTKPGPAEGLYGLAVQHMSDAWHSEECPTFLCLAGNITPSTASEEGGDSQRQARAVVLC